MQRKRFTWNDRQGLELLRAGTVNMPAIDDDRPAGGVCTLIDALVDGDAIVPPEGFRLTLINDDEIDITGLVISVHAEGTNWPAASDGWSEIDNYLPALDDEGDEEAHFLEMVSMVLGRADRCLAFLQDVQRAFAELERGVTMLCVRDPDYSNEYVADGKLTEVTIDLGGSWNSYKHFCRELAAGDPEATQYEAHVLAEVANLAPDNPVRARAEEFFKEARVQA